MQKVRLIKKDGTEMLLTNNQVSVKFKEQVVCVWDGFRWKEIPFDEMFVVSTWWKEKENEWED